MLGAGGDGTGGVGARAWPGGDFSWGTLAAASWGVVGLEPEGLQLEPSTGQGFSQGTLVAAVLKVGGVEPETGVG